MCCPDIRVSTVTADAVLCIKDSTATADAVLCMDFSARATSRCMLWAIASGVRYLEDLADPIGKVELPSLAVAAMPEYAEPR